MSKTRLITMNVNAAKALASKWFLKGFSLSGKGFHGENYDPKKHPALESLLLTEFERCWSEG